MLNIIHKKNKWLAKTAGVFLLSFFVIASFAQKGDKPLTTRSNKARKAFEESTFFYTAKKYPEAEEELRKAIHADENFIEAYLLLGDILADEHKTAESIQAYKKAIGIDAAFFPNAYFICASLELSIGRYQEAKDHFLTFSQLPDIPSEKSNKVRKAIQTCDFALNAIAHPVAFNPQNLGDSINTTDDEYANSITADDQFLFFTRKQLKENQATGKTHYEEDFFMSRSLGSKWLQARALGPPINTSGDEGAFFISPDGMDLFFA
ncbi:MAG: hypothetical protein NTU44_06545, partial [Bacteroidetes bacterium]|nr:hypothetical protein [Bacteroidota bacterium]